MNNYTYVIESLRENEFFKGVLFKTKDSKLLYYYRKTLNSKMEAIAKCQFYAILYNNIFQKMYNFTANSIKEYVQRDCNEAQTVIGIIESSIEELKAKTYISDLKWFLKKFLFFSVVNGVILKMSYIIFNYPKIVNKYKLKTKFHNDLDTLIDYFQHEKEDEYNKRFFDEVKRFIQLYFNDNPQHKNRDDELYHFVYKLRGKKHSMVDMFKRLASK